jgi:hypothetical protein
MKYPEEDYIKYDPYLDECEVVCHQVKLVKTRKEHECMLSYNVCEPPHIIPVGSIARFDKAMVDGEFGQYYSCLNCMDKYLDGCY